MRHTDIPRTNGCVLAVSQSGETKDVVRAVKAAIDADTLVMSVVNVVGSLIARTTGLGVYLNAGREHAVASTKAFVTQVTVLTLIGLWFRQLREDNLGIPESPTKRLMTESLQRLPILFGMAMKTRSRCAEIAKELNEKNNMFILGKGYGEQVALEGALKIKEMCYLHAEGYSGGALKHGPFALIEGKDGREGATPVICIVLDDDHAPLMRTVAEEVCVLLTVNSPIYACRSVWSITYRQVKARGAKVYVITDNPNLALGIDDHPIIVPNDGPLTALISVLPLQVLPLIHVLFWLLCFIYRFAFRTVYRL